MTGVFGCCFTPAEVFVFFKQVNLNHKLYIKLKGSHHDACDWLVKSCYEAPS